MRLLTSISLLSALVGACPDHNSTEYEYVIVGSGPGGGTLAANLARAGHSVFLIEAGGDNGDSLLAQVPLLRSQNSENPESSWRFFVNYYRNETQSRRSDVYTYRLNNGSFYSGREPPQGAEPLGTMYPRGATIGGSSLVNAMNIALPPDSEWNLIADLTGDESWRAENMHQYFIEIERNKYAEEGLPYHGYDGFISTIRNNVSSLLARRGGMEVLREISLSLEGILPSDEEIVELLERDINTGDPSRYEFEGILQMPLHIDEFRRRSDTGIYVMDTANARNPDGSQRYPLTVSTHSLATRVLFSHNTTSSKPKAYGVEYLKGEALYDADPRYQRNNTGELRQVTAKKEVIIAGGAFNTPQILKLSGVGPREELESLDIPVVVDLPAVGSYMQDNYESGVSVLASAPWDNNPLDACTLTPPDDPCFDQWLNEHSGPYGDGGTPACFLYRSSQSQDADADLFVFGSPNTHFPGFYPGYSTDFDALQTERSHYWSIVKMQVNNKAGNITLRSADPRQAPIINFNFMEEGAEEDLQAISEATQMVIDSFIAVRTPWYPFEVVLPPPDLDMKQAIKDHVYSHHVTSSCRMGPKDDPEYCVDSEFKVNGVDGLRVVDGSVFPRTPGGFPVGPIFVISQKAFHVITGSD